MLVEFSHILTFSMLFIAAVFDVRSEMGDVPDVFPAAAVLGGVFLHAAESFVLGSWNPLLYCLGVGAVFSVYGWAAYWKGMWGGADAFALSALGFGAPYLTLTLAGTVRHSVSLFVNLVLVSFIYTIVFSIVRAFRKEGFFTEYREKITENRKILAGISGASLAVFGFFSPLKGLGFYAFVVFSVLMYFFLKTVEEHAMVEEVKVDDLDGGEVLRGERITGVTEEEISDMEGTVEVVHGLRFLPIFPLALVITDAGFTLINYIIF